MKNLADGINFYLKEVPKMFISGIKSILEKIYQVIYNLSPTAKGIIGIVFVLIVVILAIELYKNKESWRHVQW